MKIIRFILSDEMVIIMTCLKFLSGTNQNFICFEPVTNFRYITVITQSYLGLNSNNFPLLKNVYSTPTNRDTKIAKERFFLVTPSRCNLSHKCFVGKLWQAARPNV